MAAVITLAATAAFMPRRMEVGTEDGHRDFVC